MNVWKLLSVLVVGISTSTMAYAQNLDDLDLTKGILALQCSDVDGDVDTPLVFVQGDAGWVLNGSEEVVVTEIDDGFRLTTLADPSWMSLVTEERRGDWSVRVLSEIAFTNVECTNIQDLVEILTATIAPQIADNLSEIAKEVSETIPALRAEIARKTSAIDERQNKIYELQNETIRAQGKYDSLKEVADTIPALRAEIADLKSRSRVLEIENTELSRREDFLANKLDEINQMNILLTDENTDYAELTTEHELLKADHERLKADFEILLANSIQRNAFKIGAFTTEYGYDTSDKVGSDYKFDTGVQTNVVSCNSQFDRGHDLSDICLIALKKALLPNPD